MNVIALINSLLSADSVAANVVPTGAAAGNANESNEEEPTYLDEVDGNESRGSVTFEFVAEPNRSDENESSGEEEFFDDAATRESQGSVTFEFFAEPNRSDRSESSEESEFFDDATVVDSVDNDGEESIGFDGNENAPVVGREAVAAASKVVASHPLREIARKARTKHRSPAELMAFQTRVKDYLLQLFHLSHCFNQNSGRFSRCCCLKMLEQECCFDSLAARIGMLIALPLLFRLIVRYSCFFFSSPSVYCSQICRSTVRHSSDNNKGKDSVCCYEKGRAK